jgi:ribosomal protein L29
MKFTGKKSKSKIQGQIKGKSIKELKAMRIELEKDLMNKRGTLQKAGYSQGMKGNLRDLKKNIARIETAITLQLRA